MTGRGVFSYCQKQNICSFIKDMDQNQKTRLIAQLKSEIDSLPPG